MSIAADRKDLIETPQDLSVASLDDDRLSSPAAARAMHGTHVTQDADASLNRSMVQDLKDFAPPYDPEELAARRMADRFNVNFGLAASYINEAIGAYHDLFTTPSSLVKIVLKREVDEDRRESWASIMSDEWTKMFRAWDGSAAKLLSLADIFVTHGVGIPCFKDKASMLFDVYSLEECKFPPKTTTIPSEVELMTLELDIDLPFLYSKIENTKLEELTEDMEGWNGPVVRWLIENARPQTTTPDSSNYEGIAREIKSNRLSCNTSLPSVTLVWCFVKELSGKISVYATTKSLYGQANKESDAVPHANNECWIYKVRNAFDDANQMFMIFAFSAGQKNRIHTVRGMGYALYEAGQADNVLRCKMMDAARHRASEIYGSESTLETAEDMMFIDLGHAVIAPKGLKNLQQSPQARMDQTLGFAIDSNGRVMDRHGMGLASNSVADNPNARRNEMQVTVEMAHANKMQSFAISLWYGPYDNLIRELVRRAFTETQTDRIAMGLVEVMKQACIDRGVPKDTFDKIDFPATKATRLAGAGSKGSRLIGFQQLAQMYSSMDEQGQEFFNYDVAAEIKDAEAAERYFGLPGQRRGHVDIAIAQLENEALLEGDMIEPVPGENRMVHLGIHLDELSAGLQEVNEGKVDLADWTMRHIPLYRHAVQTLEATSVHPSRMSEFKSFRQQLQQVGEIIENGMRHINKLRENGELPAPAGQEGAEQDPAAQKANAAQQDTDIRNAQMVAEANAKIQLLAMKSKADIDMKRAESMARISTLDAETFAKIRRQEILDKAGASGG